MKSILVTATPLHVEVRTALLAAIEPYKNRLEAHEILAVVSYTVGQLVAMQDQTKFTAERAMELVVANLTQGNRDAIEHIFKNLTGGAQ